MATPVAIVQMVAEEFGLTADDLTGRVRTAKIALARQVAMYFIRQKTGLTLADTGHLLGGRTPATVSWGYQRIAGVRGGKK